MRDTEEEYREVYAEFTRADPEWMELREYYDPLDGSLLDAEAVPPRYPILHDFRPDLEAFYNEWLNRPIPDA